MTELSRAASVLPTGRRLSAALLAGPPASPAPRAGAPVALQHHTPNPAQEPLIPPETPTREGPTPLTPKQKDALLKRNFETMKQQADELARLAKSLQDDLDKSNQNVLSLGVIDKAERIEKLAKKIKSGATPY